MKIKISEDERFLFPENKEMLEWINNNQEKFGNVFRQKDTFNIFDDYFTIVALRYLQAKGITEKFGMKDFGYEEYKNYTAQIFNDVISYGKKANIRNIVTLIENCKDMSEVKKLKYNVIEKTCNHISDREFDYSETFRKVIRALKKEFPEAQIIDSERKVEIEGRYQECTLYIQEEELRSYYMAVAIIDEEGIRNTYEIIEGNAKLFITESHSETNYDNSKLEEKIDKILEKIKI